MTDAIKNAIMDYLKARIERNNKGMLSTYNVKNSSIRVMHDNDLSIDKDMKYILKNDEPYIKIIRKWGKGGKELLPKLELL